VLLTSPDAVRPTRRSRSDLPAVASFPAQHPYVRHLHRDDAEPGWRSVPGPPRGFDPRWLATAEADLVHLHAGLAAYDAGRVASALTVLRGRRTPLVLTVHDLGAPGLDLLVPFADEVVTLTHGAAVRIAQRWGREPLVLPHPHVVDVRTMAVAQDCRARRRGAPFRLGLLVERGHPAAGVELLAATLATIAGGLPGAQLEVVDDVDLAVPWGPALRDLWNRVGALDAAVLADTTATHSTLLEVCRDLGTTVLTSTDGCRAEQGPVLEYAHTGRRFDVRSLADAVRTAYDARPALAATIDGRRRERSEVAAAHERLFRSLTG
jgi:hypothetical protein